MPRTLSAERAARASEKKRLHNRSIKTTIKTYIVNAEAAIASGDVEKAKIAVKDAIGKIDKAVKVNIIHDNTGARRKANIMKKLNKAFGVQTLTAGEKKPVKKPATRRKTAKKAAKTAE